ncbi:hypothetical protein HMPREF1223_13474 [Pseudomonas aeruginosa str. Stone 130]|nr:hypothetical protein HMPREF1223_13474 [Pseudomonas aeruginosa str. Stone 130]
MPRRVTLTDRQKDALLRLPTSQTDLLKHYTLSDEDLGHIRLRRRAHNRFGFALQLCVLRYPGRVLAPGELIPAEVIEFIGAQLGLGADDLVDYAAREETRHEHLAELRGLYGFRTFSGRGASELKEWLFREAEMAVSNEDIARRFVAECRRTRTVLPATSTIERLCAAALVDAERRIETRIASRLPMSIREQLLALLEETADDRVTRFVWLRQFEPGSNSSSANRLLDRLEYLQRIDLPEDLLAGVPAHRVTRLRALLQRLAAVRGRLSLCADQAAAAKWWLSMPMASVSAEGPMPKALSTRRTSPLMPGCRHQGRACPLRRARMTSNPLIVA